jgi:transposase
MRVTTAFNRLLGIAGAGVVGVRFEREGVVVGLCLRRRRLVCPGCGCLGRAGYDQRRRRWRHLDLGGTRCFLEYGLRRFRCSGCRRVVSEAVPWARPAARFTRPFETLVAWLAQQTAFSVIGRLLRVSWRSVARIVGRVVAELGAGKKLSGLRRIGVGDVSYRRGYRFLTLVADHESGRVVWAAEGHSQATLERFFDQLGVEATGELVAVSCDMWAAYQKALAARLPAQARVCVDPFHVIQRANRAVETVRKQEWRRLQQAGGGQGRWLKQTRWAVLKRPERLNPQQTDTLALLEQENARLYRAYLLKEQLRGIYACPPAQAAGLLDAWTNAAAESGLPPFQTLARTLRKHRAGVLAAIELDLSNSRLEALNSKVRLISHRSYGFHSADPLIALIHLCCGPLTIQLPT